MRFFSKINTPGVIPSPSEGVGRPPRRCLYYWTRLVATLVSFCFCFTPAVFATDKKIDYPNNKFGIHLAIVSYEDLEDAAKLVNGSGGDWGYVTVVIQDNDRDHDKWQRAFDRMRELHLIPIVRLATSFQTEKNSWRRPAAGEAEGWANFLNSLNWVVKNRYVVLFNETNGANEWGGEADPQGYGKVALEFSQKFKEKSPDFWVMLGGFNATLPQFPPDYVKEEFFLKDMVETEAGINEFFAHFDAWVSHSYEKDTYLRELKLLRSLGLKKDLPVFITEAGWPHAEGISYDSQWSSEKVVAQKMVNYFASVAADRKVVAITPFVLNYQGDPFDHFSWRKPQDGEYYSQFTAVSKMPKTKGQPEQNQGLEIMGHLPTRLIRNSVYQLAFKIRNTGQAIWSHNEGYLLSLQGPYDGFEYFFSEIDRVAPLESQTVWLYLKTKDEEGKFSPSIVLTKNGKAVGQSLLWPVEIFPAISADLDIKLWPNRKVNGGEFRLIIYNADEEVVFERSGLVVKDGQVHIDNIHNVSLGQKYRFVLLKPYFLPQQVYVDLEEIENKAILKPLLPVDFNLDGKLSFWDLLTVLRHPALLQKVF